MVRVLLVTEEVIARVNHLASKQQQPTVHNRELLFKWQQGQPFESDRAYLDLWSNEDIAGQQDEIIPEPITDKIDDDALPVGDDEQSAHKVTEDDHDNPKESSLSHDEDNSTNDDEDDDDVDHDISYDPES